MAWGHHLPSLGLRSHLRINRLEWTVLKVFFRHTKFFQILWYFRYFCQGLLILRDQNPTKIRPPDHKAFWSSCIFQGWTGGPRKSGPRASGPRGLAQHLPLLCRLRSPSVLLQTCLFSSSSAHTIYHHHFWPFSAADSFCFKFHCQSLLFSKYLFEYRNQRYQLYLHVNACCPLKLLLFMGMWLGSPFRN